MNGDGLEHYQDSICRNRHGMHGWKYSGEYIADVAWMEGTT